MTFLNFTLDFIHNVDYISSFLRYTTNLSAIKSRFFQTPSLSAGFGVCIYILLLKKGYFLCPFYWG